MTNLIWDSDSLLLAYTSTDFFIIIIFRGGIISQVMKAEIH